jgi:glycosyltransferase involved in cell wall biosynthesis
MGAPKISVIVTNFNYGRYLYECVDSIRSQTFKDLELIIVDDSSTDGSSLLATRLADKAITFSKNQGTRVASNAGVQIASGTYCVFVNADDKIEPTFLSECIKTLESDPSLALTYTDFWHFGQSGEKSVDNGVILHEWNLETLKDFNYILCSALFKRDVFLKVGGFEVDYGMEDYDLWLRMGLQGHKGKRTPGYLYHYRAHNANRTHKVNVQGAMTSIKARHGLNGPVSTYGSSTEVVFSICYATRRSWCIKTVVHDWLEKAQNKKAVEFVVCVDGDDLASVQEGHELCRRVGNAKIVVQNHEPFNAVKAWNEAAKSSTGKVLVMISDDFVPPKEWDSQLVGLKSNWIDERWVVRVNDCNNSSVNKPITLPILTRARYEELGYVFWHEYESMFSDTEFTDHAKLDGIVLDARTMLFEHLHPTCFKRNRDSVDDVHASTQRWNSGQAIYNKRKANGFKVVQDQKPKIDIVSTWQAYTFSVKSTVYSISLEGSLWLEEFLVTAGKSTAIEIGANFASVVFNSAGLKTTITDPSLANTLGTSQFIKKHGGHVRSIDIQDLKSEKFDVVFVNAHPAESAERHALITEVAPTLVNDGGVIILNDGHFVNVRKAMDKLVSMGWDCEVPQKTMDKYDRYWMVLTSQNKS